MGAMRGCLEQFTTKNISVVKNLPTSAFTPVGYPGGVGHGIIRPPITVVPHPKLAKDVSYVAAPAPHRACAGRNCSCGPRGLSQRPSLSGVNPTIMSQRAIRRKNRQMKELSDDLFHTRTAHKPYRWPRYVLQSPKVKGNCQ